MTDMIIDNNIDNSKVLGIHIDVSYMRTPIKVFLDSSHPTPMLLIKVNSELLPISWFVTSKNGNVVRSGVSITSNVLVSLCHLDKGEYTLRMNGERFVFSI